MTKKHSTKVALLTSVIALVVCVSMLIGTTFAWFTDSATSSNNIIKTGTLDVEMSWADGTEDPATTTWTDASVGAIFNYDKWEPGYAEVRHIKISNVGDLALKYRVSIIANGTVSDLADVIDVYYVDPAVKVATADDLANAPKIGTLTQVLGNLGDTAEGKLLAGTSDTITIALKMQETAGNEYMGKSIGTDFSIVLVATQATYESGSAGDQYDKDAPYPEVVLGTAQKAEGKPAKVNADFLSINVPAEADEGAYTIELTNKKVKVDPDGKNTVDIDIVLKKNGVKIQNDSTVYTVSAYIGEGRTNIALTHNGVSINDYEYNEEEGILSFGTNSFSPYSFSFYSDPTDKVAMTTADDGIVYYFKDLQKALNASKNGGTVTILATVYLDETAVISKDITLDMNNKTVRTNASLGTDPLFKILASVTVKNGKIKGDDNATRYGFEVGNETVKGALDISDGRYQTSGSAVYVVNGTANVSGGQFIVWPAANTLKAVDCLDSAYEAGKADIRVTGGQFTYTGDPAKFVPDGYASSVYQTYTGGIYEYIVGEAVASVELADGTVKYECAVASALQYTIPTGKSGKVTILKDHNANVNTLYNGSVWNIYDKDVVLDLNGKTVTFDNSVQTVDASKLSGGSIYVGKASLKIVDSGEGGKIYNKQFPDGDTSNRRFTKLMFAGSNSNVVIEDGIFINENLDAMFYTTSPASFTVKGGEFYQYGTDPDVGMKLMFNKNNSNMGSQNIQLVGGMFNVDPTVHEVSLPAGYSFAINADGMYCVVADPA